MAEGDWQPLRLTRTENNTQYNETFTDLEPGTRYVFRVNVVYRSFEVLAWPADPIFIFETQCKFFLNFCVLTVIYVLAMI